jgi:hypothetical protein
MLAALTLAAALSGPLPPANAGACLTRNAHYVLRGDPKVTVEFGRYLRRPESFASDLYLVYHTRHTGHTYWYGMDWGSDDIFKLYPVGKPGKGYYHAASGDGRAVLSDDMTIWGTDAQLNFIDEWAESRGRAPKYIFIPELNDVMRHDPNDPEVVATAFFILKSCVKR